MTVKQHTHFSLVSRSATKRAKSKHKPKHKPKPRGKK